AGSWRPQCLGVRAQLVHEYATDPRDCVGGLSAGELAIAERLPGRDRMKHLEDGDDELALLGPELLHHAFERCLEHLAACAAATITHVAAELRAYECSA